MTEDEGIWGYDPSICRSIGATYRRRSKYNGIPVWVYELDLSEDVNIKQCFCRDEDTCPPKGTFDLFRCSGVRTNLLLLNIPDFDIFSVSFEFIRFQCTLRCHIFIKLSSYWRGLNLVFIQIKRTMELK